MSFMCSCFSDELSFKYNGHSGQPLKSGNRHEIISNMICYRFRPPEAPQATKAAIRAMLPHGLKESISKVHLAKSGVWTNLNIQVRNTVAFCLAAIAHWDWPDAWPQLFDILMQAMKVKIKLSRDLEKKNHE